MQTLKEQEKENSKKKLFLKMFNMWLNGKNECQAEEK